MKIRGPGDGSPPRRPTTGELEPAAARPLGQPASPARRGGQDAFRREREPAAEAPFWLLAMAADRAAGRRYLDEAARRRARALERAWIAEWAAAAAVTPPPGTSGRASLVAWQALVDAWCAAAGWPIGTPRVCWQAELGPDAPVRGQYLFRADGGLLQLRPAASGTPAEWLATVAHETFHHAQHALVVANYRGSPALPPPFDALAAYYRDARATYRLPGPGLPPEAHRRQDLEIGAWAFGAAIAERIG